MKYLSNICRQKNNFRECAKKQFEEYYRYAGPIEYSDELIISKNHDYSKYRDAKILIIGGGPSTNDCKWSSTEYDYVFSCNHFFLAEKLNGVNVDLAAVCPEVDIKSKSFQEYLLNSKTLFCIENVDVPLSNVEYLLSINRLVLVSLRLNIKIGTAAKLLIITSYFKPSEIHIIGMDGMPNGSVIGDDSKHSFQPGKPLISKNFSYEKYVQGYRALWEYLLNDIGRGIKYKNLGHGHKYNISTIMNIL